MSFFSAADGQTESRMYWSFVTPCSLRGGLYPLLDIWLAIFVDNACELRGVGDFFVQVLLVTVSLALASACCSSKCEISTSSTCRPYRSRHSSANSLYGICSPLIVATTPGI